MSTILIVGDSRKNMKLAREMTDRRMEPIMKLGFIVAAAAMPLLFASMHVLLEDVWFVRRHKECRR